MWTQRVQMKGILLCLIPWDLCAGTRDFYPTLAALIATVKHIFSLIVHYFKSFVPIAQQAGQAVVPGPLLLCCPWLTVYATFFVHQATVSTDRAEF
jgi:hypothetical protein